MKDKNKLKKESKKKKTQIELIAETKKQKTFSLDLGENWGWAYVDDIGADYGNMKSDNYLHFYENVARLIDFFLPEIVVVAQINSHGHYNASRALNRYCGIVYLICEKRSIMAVELNDSSARKAVLGKALKKVEVQGFYPDIQSDALDALIIAKGWRALH